VLQIAEKTFLTELGALSLGREKVKKVVDDQLLLFEISAAFSRIFPEEPNDLPEVVPDDFHAH